MEDMTITANRCDFSAVHTAMRRYVDREILSGVSYAILRGRDLIDVRCTGWSDREQGVALRVDHLFRAFSNTKLVTFLALYCFFLKKAGSGWMTRSSRYIPQLANRQVLRPGATKLEDTRLPPGRLRSVI